MAHYVLCAIDITSSRNDGKLARPGSFLDPSAWEGMQSAGYSRQTRQSTNVVGSRERSVLEVLRRVHFQS
jgi:hypothetical protein